MCIIIKQMYYICFGNDAIIFYILIMSTTKLFENHFGNTPEEDLKKNKFNNWAKKYFTKERLNSFIPYREARDQYCREVDSRISMLKFVNKLKTWSDLQELEYNPIEFRSPDGYIRKNKNGVTVTCLYIKKSNNE